MFQARTTVSSTPQHTNPPPIPSPRICDARSLRLLRLLVRFAWCVVFRFEEWEMEIPFGIVEEDGTERRGDVRSCVY